MTTHRYPISILSLLSLLAAGCDEYVELEPDPPGPPSEPDGGPVYPPPEVFPDELVVTTPGAPPAPPPDGVDDGVEVVFPPPASITTESRVTMRGTARLAGGATAVRVNGVAARLSQPNGDGAVAWQVELMPARGRNDIVVSSTDGDDNDMAVAARAMLELAPYMPIQPHALDLDVDHDRLFVSDTGARRGIVAIDLETGASGRVEVDLGPDLRVTPYAMSIDAAARRGVALFGHQSCTLDTMKITRGMLDIDLEAASFEVDELVESPASCNWIPASPDVREAAIVLDAGEQRVFTLHEECVYDADGNRDCVVDFRTRRLGDGAPPAQGAPLCVGEACLGLDLVVDRRDPAGFELLALVRQGTWADSGYELYAIDPVAGSQTLIATVQELWDERTFRPDLLALDTAGNRVFVLGNQYPDRMFVISIDLASGSQSFAGKSDEAVLDDFIGDAVYDPRRERLIFTAHTGVFAMDVATSATTPLFRPALGDGPTPWCDDACSISNVDDARQRLLVHSPETADRSGSIYEVDLRTGDRRVLPGPGATELGSGGILFADYPEDRAFVMQPGARLHRVDGATGERVDLGLSPVFPFENAAWDPERGRILYLWGDELRAIDVDTGEDSLISADGLGSGVSLSAIVQSQPLSLDASGTRAFASDLSRQRLISVDLVTGDRTVHTVPELPGDMDDETQVLADTRRGRFLVAGAPPQAITAIDLSTGEQSVFADREPLRGQLVPDHSRDRALIIEGERRVQMLDLLTGQRVQILQLGP